MRLPSPRRVRNIFICIVVAFCASSSTTKAFAQRPPAHEGQRRDLDPLFLDQLLHLLLRAGNRSAHRRAAACRDRPCPSCRRAESPRRSPASTAGRDRMILSTCPPISIVHADRDGEIGLAGAGRADAECQFIARTGSRHRPSAPRCAARPTCLRVRIHTPAPLNISICSSVPASHRAMGPAHAHRGVDVARDSTCVPGFEPRIEARAAPPPPDPARLRRRSPPAGCPVAGYAHPV